MGAAPTGPEPRPQRRDVDWPHLGATALAGSDAGDGKPLSGVVLAKRCSGTVTAHPTNVEATSTITAISAIPPA